MRYIYNLESYVYRAGSKRSLFFLFLRNREWKVQSKLVKGFPGTKVQLRRMGLGETAATRQYSINNNTAARATNSGNKIKISSIDSRRSNSSSSNTAAATTQHKQQQQHSAKGNTARAVTRHSSSSSNTATAAAT
jgi:hypothetical protein